MAFRNEFAAVKVTACDEVNKTMDYSDYSVPGTTIEERYIPVADGVELYVIDFTPPDEDQTKPVVVFVAGWISMITGWKAFLRVLTKHYRVIYVESREKGSCRMQSPATEPFTIDQFAADLSALLPQVVPPGRKFVLSASSLGSTTVLESLAAGPVGAQASWVIAPNAEFGFPRFLFFIVKHFPIVIWYIGLKPVVKFYIKHFRLDRKKEPEQWDKYNRTLDDIDPVKLKRNVIALDTYSLWEKLPDINDKVVVVGGESDKLHGAEFMQRIVDAMPNAELVMMASNKETHSDKAAQLLVDYLDQLDNGGS